MGFAKKTFAQLRARPFRGFLRSCRMENTMSDKMLRRDILKASLTAAGATYLGLPVLSIPSTADTAEASAPVSLPIDDRILPLTTSSDVYVPPRGNAHLKFSFDFPEPSVAFNGLLFSFRLHTFENIYGLDRASMKIEEKSDGLEIHCSQFVWAGDQQKAPGTLRARLRKNGSATEWEVSAETGLPIKSITSIVRGVPRGQLSVAGEKFFDPKDNEHSFGHPYLFGDMSTPLVVIKKGEKEFFFLFALIQKIRATRFYFQPGEKGYRAELIYEREGWEKSNHIESPVWRVGYAESIEAAARPHFESLEKAFGIPDWDTRTDMPAWTRDISLVVALHGMHWTGYIFNDYAKIQKILEWVATQIPAKRVLIFIPAWDGRYYWNYPRYK